MIKYSKPSSLNTIYNTNVRTKMRTMKIYWIQSFSIVQLSKQNSFLLGHII